MSDYERTSMVNNRKQCVSSDKSNKSNKSIYQTNQNQIVIGIEDLDGDVHFLKVKISYDNKSKLMTKSKFM